MESLTMTLLDLAELEIPAIMELVQSEYKTMLLLQRLQTSNFYPSYFSFYFILFVLVELFMKTNKDIYSL